MTLSPGWLPWFPSSTLRALHRRVNRNIQRSHQQTRHESSKPSQQPTPKPTTPIQAQPGPTLPTWADPILRPFKGYSAMQARSPLITQWESALIIYYLGDLSSQVVITNSFREERYEPIRGLRAMAIGALAAIPSYKWFKFLGDSFNLKSPALSICVRIVVHQAFFVPVFNAYFFGAQTVFAGGTLREAKDRILRQVPVSWWKSCQFWPVVNAFVFSVVPWQYRNVFSGVVAIGWQTYLCWLNREDERRVEAFKRKEGQEEGKNGMDAGNRAAKKVSDKASEGKGR